MGWDNTHPIAHETKALERAIAVWQDPEAIELVDVSLQDLLVPLTADTLLTIIEEAKHDYYLQGNYNRKVYNVTLFSKFLEILNV